MTRYALGVIDHTEDNLQHFQISDKGELRFPSFRMYRTQAFPSSFLVRLCERFHILFNRNAMRSELWMQSSLYLNCRRSILNKFYFSRTVASSWTSPYCPMLSVKRWAFFDSIKYEALRSFCSDLAFVTDNNFKKKMNSEDIELRFSHSIASQMEWWLSIQFLCGIKNC